MDSAMLDINDASVVQSVVVEPASPSPKETGLRMNGGRPPRRVNSVQPTSPSANALASQNGETLRKTGSWYGGTRVSTSVVDKLLNGYGDLFTPSSGSSAPAGSVATPTRMLAPAPPVMAFGAQLPEHSAIEDSVKAMTKEQMAEIIMKTHSMMVRANDEAVRSASSLSATSSSSTINSNVGASFGGASMMASGSYLSASHNSSLPGSNISLLQAQSIRSIVSMRKSGVPPRMTEQLTKGVDPDDGSKLINDYIVLDNLGRGQFGKVKLAYCPKRNEPVAIKIIRRRRQGSPAANFERRLMREIAIMKRLRHKNIVSLYEVIDDPSAEKLYLVMQYVDKGPIASIDSEGNASRILSPEMLQVFARNVCAGLKYLHDRRIVHRDIKPENILVSSADVAYLGDFGTAEICDAERSAAAGDGKVTRQSTLPVYGHTGTINYMGPELFKESVDAIGDDVVDGAMLDVWALGVSFYVLLVGKQPFVGISEIRKAVLPEWPESFEQAKAGSIRHVWKSLIEKMLVVDPQKRLQLNEVRRTVKGMQPLLTAPQVDPAIAVTTPLQTKSLQPTSPGATILNEVDFNTDIAEDEIRNAITPMHQSTVQVPDFDVTVEQNWSDAIEQSVSAFSGVFTTANSVAVSGAFSGQPSGAVFSSSPSGNVTPPSVFHSPTRRISESIEALVGAPELAGTQPPEPKQPKTLERRDTTPPSQSMSMSMGEFGNPNGTAGGRAETQQFLESETSVGQPVSDSLHALTPSSSNSSGGTLNKKESGLKEKLSKHQELDRQLRNEEDEDEVAGKKDQSEVPTTNGK